MLKIAEEYGRNQGALQTESGEWSQLKSTKGLKPESDSVPLKVQIQKWIC